MAKKKKAIQPDGPVSNPVEEAFQEAGITATEERPSPNGDGQEPEQPIRRPVRETFTSTAAGVHGVEDKRFNLPRVGIDFADDARATEEEKAQLKEAGFRYDPRDKGYTALANRETRTARDTLAQSFTEKRLAEKGDEGKSR